MAHVNGYIYIYIPRVQWSIIQVLILYTGRLQTHHHIWRNDIREFQGDVVDWWIDGRSYQQKPIPLKYETPPRSHPLCWTLFWNILNENGWDYFVVILRLLFYRGCSRQLATWLLDMYRSAWALRLGHDVPRVPSPFIVGISQCHISIAVERMIKSLDRYFIHCSNMYQQAFEHQPPLQLLLYHVLCRKISCAVAGVVLMFFKPCLCCRTFAGLPKSRVPQNPPNNHI